MGVLRLLFMIKFNTFTMVKAARMKLLRFHPLFRFFPCPSPFSSCSAAAQSIVGSKFCATFTSVCLCTWLHLHQQWCQFQWGHLFKTHKSHILFHCEVPVEHCSLNIQGPVKSTCLRPSSSASCLVISSQTPPHTSLWIITLGTNITCRLPRLLWPSFCRDVFSLQLIMS